MYSVQNSTNLKQYYATCFSLIAGIMLFGGLLAPSVSSTTLEDSHNTVDEFWITCQINSHGIFLGLGLYNILKACQLLFWIQSLYLEFR